MNHRSRRLSFADTCVLFAAIVFLGGMPTCGTSAGEVNEPTVADQSAAEISFTGNGQPPASDAPIVYQRDVMAVLSKAGCNMGACHGNFRGKGGFRLSLRGQDPALDFNRIVDESAGRRINRLDPSQSLLLLKPTAQVAHQGGMRFQVHSPEYRILHDWIRQGVAAVDDAAMEVIDLQVTPDSAIVFAPQAELALRVEATFADGSRRDVTNLAVYEPSAVTVDVSPSGIVQRRELGEVTVAVRYLQMQVAVPLAFAEDHAAHDRELHLPSSVIDRSVLAKLGRLHIDPSAICDDPTFVRRVYLDLVGLLPTAEQARRFVQAKEANKRQRLVEQLLVRPEFADFWALKWSDMLRNEEKILDPNGVEVFHAWLRDSIARNMPLDQFARELLTGRGSTYKVPPANFYRASRSPVERGEAVARLFLGQRLQCAQCHNHPFDRWTQNDYYAWAALFARIDYEIVSNERRDNLDKNEFNGEQVVVWKSEGEVTHPDSGAVMQPRLLGVEQPLPDGSDRLPALATWLTSRDNRQFARAQANWIWSQLMGRGIVEPVDDFRTTNPPSHPELLEHLANELVSHQFDLRQLISQITATEAYQRSYEPNETNTSDDSNYSKAIVRRLTAEQLLDAQSQVLQVPLEFAGHSRGLRAGQLPGVHKTRPRDQRPTDADRFLFAFGKPERLLACDCERSAVTTLNQALLLTSGGLVDGLLEDSHNVLYSALEQEKPLDVLVDDLYWSALTRPPTDTEKHAVLTLVKQGIADDTLARLQDFVWSLLNAKEFVFRH